MPPERRFTVEEANALLEDLRARLARIKDARRALLASGERIRTRAGRNGGGTEGAAFWEATRTLRTELESLAAEGIVLRDAEVGLVDFPAEREGHLVYLCWRVDEDRVSHWHEVDAGFAGRRSL